MRRLWSLATLCSLATLLVLSSCEITPFDIKADYCRDLSIESNIKKIKALELSKKAGRFSGQFKVALIGDAQTRPAAFRQVIQQVNDKNTQGEQIDFAFILGDLTDAGLAAEFNWVCQSLKKLSIPFLPVIGNHDGIANGKAIWSKYFGPYDFAFGYMGTKFVVYNDNAYEFSNVPDRGFIARESALAVSEVRNHTIAVSHIPPLVDVHSQPIIDDFLRFMKSNQIKYSLHAHRHQFMHYKDNLQLEHHVTSSVWNGEWAIMTVNKEGIEFQNCVNSSCSTSTP